MKIIVGLGNPGKEYLLTRHNLGFMLIDALVEEDSFQKKHKSLIYKKQTGGDSLLLVKPQTFMNLSGQAVREVMSFYKIPIENLLVIHDDKDLLFGQMKFQKDRGHGGHNGIANIHQELGSKDYCRLKLGVAPVLEEQEKGPKDTSQLVLSKFSKKEQEKLPQFLEQALTAVYCFIEKGWNEAANQFNSKTV